jgi:Ferric reductase like transmembrane component
VLLASNSLDWYMARASGVVAYLVLTAVVVVGVALAGKVRVRWPRFAVVDVHRFGGMLVGVFVGLHLATLALDTYLPFSLAQLVVPFASRYRPLPTALGIVAMELLVAVAVTNRIRKRLPYRVWRRAHYATFAVWLAATGHGLTAGSDRGSLWLSALYLVSITAVLTAVAARISRRTRPALGLGQLALPSLAVALLATLTLGSAPRTPAPHPPAGFNGQLSARVSNRAGQALALTSVSGRAARSGRQVVFRIDLLGNGQQVAATALQLRYAGKTAAACAGTVTRLDPKGFAGTCRFGDGSTQTVQASWQLTGNNLAGRLHVGLAS